MSLGLALPLPLPPVPGHISDEYCSDRVIEISDVRRGTLKSDVGIDVRNSDVGIDVRNSSVFYANSVDWRRTRGDTRSQFRQSL